MTKSDFPALRMVVQSGRLVPATPFDQERLDSYRRGTKVSVRLTEEKDRVLVRKWWAVLGLVVKQCDTPWKTKEGASEAIKLALGIVNLSKTVGGAFMQYPKSLSELEDPELQEAVDQMVDLVHRITGVDPETLRKEAASVGEEAETAADEELPAADEEHQDEKEFGSDPLPEPDGALPPAPEGGEASPPPASPPSSDPHRDLLIRYARDVLPRAADSSVPLSQLSAIEKRWAAEIRNLPEDPLATAKLIAANMRAIANGRLALTEAVAELAEIIGCDPAEIGGTS